MKLFLYKFLQNGFFWILILLFATLSTSYLTHQNVLTVTNTTLRQKKLALTFDVEGNHPPLHEILRILNQYHTKATFFISGTWALEHPKEVLLLTEYGHEIGNYGTRYKNMARLSKENIKKEIYENHQIIKKITGLSMNLFRPPAGLYRKNLIQVTKDMGYMTITWDIDSMDWKNYNAKTITNHVLNHKRLKNGTIIRMHTNGAHTLESLESILSALQSRNFSLDTVSNILNNHN